MLFDDYQTNSAILNFILDKPFLSVVGYLAFNLLVLGVNGIFGGFLPTKVNVTVNGEKHTFCTSRRNAYHSERLTRIVQWRYCDGKNLSNEDRNAILDEFGPSKKGWMKHYKKVEHAKTEKQ